MSTLHTVNKSPFERNALKSCLGHLTAGDAVLMIEDGVVGARKGGALPPMVQAALQKCARSMRLRPIWPRAASSRRT